MFKKKNDEQEASEPATLDDAAKLLLRITIGGLMLLHGFAKLRNGVDGIEGMLTGAGLPVELAYGVYVGEVLAPLLMILGAFTRTASAIFAFNMLAAIYLGHRNDVLTLNQFGGWAIELPVLFLAGAVCLVLSGSGKFALRP